MFDDQQIQALKEIARQAGEAILTIYHQDDLGIQHKSDKTPVTQADLKANEVIEQGLKALDVQYPILSEESEHSDYTVRSQWQRYWLVDPLDGTQEFINGNGQFTVNIALMEKSEDGRSYPVLGVVYVPTENTTYWGGKSLGAFKQTDDGPTVSIAPRPFQPEIEAVTLGSRSYRTERAAAFAEKLKAIYPNLEERPVGSALKSCHVAEGLADLYPRLGPTSEWDTAAAQGVVEGAGGLLLDPHGKRFSYNFKESLLNSDFLVVGDRSQNWRKIWNPIVLIGL
ncbi:3'(2'),5'-bisphosphate nucleotidase CysQ [Endozoicomonas arenosclerae]|uniref:3'(2'),5'-bisphosphate nucleotidase CysQ n=1 Tax=Endozoicomonas arenosclerae TaxID=1633495 RepID=UPI000780F870|nr:3'(2'),5'-bisphosphate nucleotidase CysQ [Endozoicomonas arenosclerae]